jgi:hypothetical protein
MNSWDVFDTRHDTVRQSGPEIGIQYHAKAFFKSLNGSPILTLDAPETPEAMQNRFTEFRQVDPRRALKRYLQTDLRRLMSRFATQLWKRSATVSRLD